MSVDLYNPFKDITKTPKSIIMLRNIVLLSYFWLTMIITLLFYPVYHLLNLFSNRIASRFLMHATRIWSNHLLFVGEIKIDVKGRENIPESDEVCFVSNHQSYLDIPVIDGIVPKQLGFIAKKELNRIPILNLWMPVMGCVLIDRKNSSQSLSKASERIRKIAKGKPLFIFPEGTRSKSKRMGRFKTGSLGFLLQHNILVVPITINGTYKLLEEKNSIRKGKVDVYIHPPISTKEIGPENYKEFAKQLREIIEKPLKT